MINNPFTSKIYELTWLKYFTKYNEGIVFKFVNGLRFYKHSFLPYYINVGRNFTNGITYNLDYNATDFKKKTVLIYDVPSYIKIEPPKNKSKLKLYRINQYKGYLANLSETESLNSYLAENFNNKARNKFKSTLRKFEECFDVQYSIYHNYISKEEYEQTINEFKNIIIKRFETLKLDTNLIREWPFYTELAYKMILEGKAILIAIRANKKPVSMALAYIGDDVLIGAIKAFDTDYYKFNVGHIEIGKIIEFCLHNNLKCIDFSKGSYEYKLKWTNYEYRYSCHILYDNSSFISIITAKLLASFFRLKQYLRDKNFNLFIVKFQYKLQNIKLLPGKKPEYVIKSIEDNFDFKNAERIDLERELPEYFKRDVFDFLYRNPEPFQNLKCYKQINSTTNKSEYVIIGKKNRYKIETN